MIFYIPLFSLVIFLFFMFLLFCELSERFFQFFQSSERSTAFIWLNEAYTFINLVSLHEGGFAKRYCLCLHIHKFTVQIYSSWPKNKRLCILPTNDLTLKSNRFVFVRYHQSRYTPVCVLACLCVCVLFFAYCFMFHCFSHLLFFSHSLLSDFYGDVIFVCAFVQAKCSFFARNICYASSYIASKEIQ